MPVTINTSNILIETATSNYALDLVRKKSKRKNIVEDTATVTPSLNNKYSYTDNLYKYMNFTYDETMYPSISADANNLIVWWKFDSNLLFHNSAPNPLSLTLTSRNNLAADGTFTMTDKYLGSGSFYKSTQSDLYGYNITPSNWLSQSLGLEATFAFWVKQTYSTTTNMEAHIFRQDNSFIIRQYNTTGFQVYIAPDNWANIDTASGDFLFTYDTWVHVTVTVNMNSGTQINDVVNIYKNGVLRPTTVTGTYSTVIGVGFNNDSDNFRFTSSSDTTNFDDGFMGYLDDFRIYNKCLTGEEVYELYRSYRATEYNVNFDNNTECDLLIVGGGGGGSRSIGGGGGAGALIYDNFIFKGGKNYKFRVGKGGMGVSVHGNISGTVTTDMKTGESGGDTEIIIENSCLYRAKGGGGGTGDTTDYTNPSTQEAGRGGSGGGNGGKDTAHGGLLSNENIVNGNVIAVARNVYNTSHAPHYLSTKIFGNEGGIGNGNDPWGGSGGGGAGARGADCNLLNPTANNLVKGGDGLAAINDIDFGTYFNIKNKEIGHHYNGQVYFAGGGGGGNYNGNVYYNDGGLGGGGRSGMVNTGRLSTIDGLPNTGGGGGGEGYDQYQGGHGGSGIIILKHKLYYKDGDDCTIQWIHDNASDKIHSFGSVGIGTDGDEKYMLNVKGDINFTGDLYKNNVLIETPKHIIETVATEQNAPIVYSGERLYPSQYARRNYFGRIDGLSPDEYYISDADNPYGRGKYIVKYSSRYNTDTIHSPHYVFYRPYPQPSASEERDATWATGQYSSGDYVGTNSLGGKKGDWISIQMPSKIILTRYIFVSIHYQNGIYRCRLPHKYTIYGCNDGDEKWEAIIHDSLATDGSSFTHTYVNSNDSYMKVIADSERLTGEKKFNTFALLVEKVGNWNSSHNSLLAMAEFELYGKEEISGTQTPIYKNVIAYPVTYSTSNAMINGNHGLAAWSDNGYYVQTRTSSVLGSYSLYYLFNETNISEANTYHSNGGYNTGSPYLYNGSTTFKSTKGVYIIIDLGRSIYPNYTSFIPRSNSNYPDNGGFLNGCPGRFKIYGSNDDDCYNDDNHGSWVEILHQSTSLTNSNYSQSLATNIYFKNSNIKYRYYALLTTHLSGGYGHLMLSDWHIFGTEDHENIYKYMALTYYEPGEFATNVDFDYPVLTTDATNLIAWYKFDDSTNIGLDSSGNNNDITEITGITNYDNYNKIFDNFLLVKSNEYVEISTLSSLNALWSGTFSISFWIYMSSNTKEYLVGGWDSEENNGLRGGWYITINNGKVEWIGLTNGSFSTLIISDDNIILNRWNHISLSNTGTVFKVALNSINKTVNYSSSLDTPYEPIANRYLAIGAASRWSGNQTLIWDWSWTNSHAEFTGYTTSVGGTWNGNSFWTTEGYGAGAGFFDHPNTGWVKIPLSEDYNYVSIFFGNPHSGGTTYLQIGGVAKASCSAGQTKTYSEAYSGTPEVYIYESIGIIHPDLKITMSVQDPTEVYFNDFRIYDKILSDAEITELYEPYRQSAGQSQYKVTFNQNTECDILVVGGGGAGGVHNGGGGGGGGVLYATNLTLNGDYIVKIGNGGNVAPTNTQSLLSENGYNTLFGKSGDLLEVFGGGRGANANGPTVTPNKNGADGGSGGGGGNNDGIGGSPIQPNYSTLITSSNSSYYGGTGGTSVNDTNGGGGGAGGVTPNIKNGADGIQINITGNNYYWGGGGGGADWNVLGGSGGKGGGGGAGGTSGNGGSGGTGGISVGSDGTGSGGANAQSGVGGDGGPGTGGGGGANAAFSGEAASGNGGSGIVIIRYKTSYNTSSYSLSQWTYNNDDSVYHMGKVGIGTSNPSTALDVMGDVTGNTKNFKIIHPLNDKKWLLHGTIEAPRYDNIYRGKKTIKNGKCSISIDRDCNESGGMTKGTFIALNKNYQLYLQNNNTYDKVIGEIGTDGIIRIRCENTTDEIEIDWMVIGERKDSNVVNEPITNASGSLICEHYMSGYNENNVDI